MPKPKNLKKAEKISRVIAHLFARNGYHKTSMRDIARKLGMNQSSLYHYFKSKEDMLFKLMNDAMDDAMPVLEEICQTRISAEEKLRNVLGFYTRYFAGDQDRLILLVNEREVLSEKYKDILIEKERRYVRLFKEIFEDLWTQKKARDIPPQIATFAFLGMVHYTINWYRQSGPVGLEQLAEYFVDIFTRGILQRP
jgi:AcrR family transcriptional regulator